MRGNHQSVPWRRSNGPFWRSYCSRGSCTTSLPCRSFNTEITWAYGEGVKQQYGSDFKIRIGLNSGPVVVGSIGDDLRMDYTAQGDTANLASRMESSAQPGSILASNHIYRQAKEFFKFEPVGQLHVKGKEEPVEAYRLIKPTEVETRIAASAARGLTRFVGREREIATLKEAFDKVQSGEGQVVGIVGESGVGE